MENSISRQNVNVNVRAVVTDPNVTVQYKTKVLQKNVVSGVNTLTPAMIAEANTKYIIKYDYTLSDNITIPANCVLEFDGGSLNNGTIIGNNTKIKASCSKIFNSVICTGSYKNTVTYFSWFSHSNVNNTEELKSLFILSEGSIFTDVYIEEGLFYVDGYDEQNESPSICHLPDNSYIHNLATFKVLGTSHDASRPFYIAGRKNITLDGGRVIGCMDDYEVHPDYQGHYGLRIYGAENITVKNIIFEKCVSDGIETQYNASLSMHNKHIRIDSVVCDHNGRQGLSIEDGDDIIVTNSIFKNTGNPIGTNPKCGIDVEPYYSGAVICDCIIQDCVFENNTNGDVQVYIIPDLSEYKNVILNNLVCDGRIIFASLPVGKEVRISNSKFTQLNIGCLGSVYVDNCTFTNIYSSAVGELFVSNSNIIYLSEQVYLGVLCFMGNYNEAQKVQFINSYIETKADFASSNSKLDFTNCAIKVTRPLTENGCSLYGDLINCIVNVTGKTIQFLNVSNSEMVIKSSSIFLHNTGASYTGQWAPIRFTKAGSYKLIDSKLMIDEESSTTDLFLLYYTVLSVDFFVNCSIIDKYNRDLENIANLFLTYSNGFNIIENNKQLYHIENAWFDAVGNIVAFDVIGNITNGTVTRKSADKDVSYRCRLRNNTGYSLPSSVVITMGNTTLTAGTDYTYDQSTGWIDIFGVGGSGGVTDNITITAECVANP